MTTFLTISIPAVLLLLSWAAFFMRIRKLKTDFEFERILANSQHRLAQQSHEEASALLQQELEETITGLQQELTEVGVLVEENVTKLMQANSQLQDHLARIGSYVRPAIVKMRQLDRMGAFEGDDEVGIAFKAIKDIIEYLDRVDEFIVEEEEEEDGQA